MRLAHIIVTIGSITYPHCQPEKWNRNVYAGSCVVDEGQVFGLWPQRKHQGKSNMKAICLVTANGCQSG